MSLRLGYLEAAWFRGFCGKQRVAFASGATVLYGPNGSGKSSIVEGLEWVFFGQIGRASRATNRQEYVGQRHVANPRRPEGGQTYVEVTVERQGNTHVLRRELVDFNTTRLLLDGNEVSDLAEAFGISVHEMRKPVISRTEGRMLIDAPPTERWERLMTLLGVDVFARVRELLAQESQRLGRDHDLTRADVTRADLVRSGYVQVAGVITHTPFSRADVVRELLAAAADEGVAEDSVSAAAEGLRGLAPPARPPLPALPSELATTGVVRAREAFEALPPVPEKDSDQARRRFLREGLQLAAPDDSTCPFCGESTLNAERLRALQSEVESLAAVAENERTRQARIGELRTAAAGLGLPLHGESFRVDCERAGATPDALDQLIGSAEDLVRLRAAAQEALVSLADCTSRDDWDARRVVTKDGLSGLESAIEGLRQAEVALKQSVPHQPGRDETADRRRDVLRRACEQLDLLARAGAIRTVRSRVDALCQHLKQAEREAVRSRIDRISTRVVELYERLNPDEGVKPTRLDIHEGERNEVRLHGETYGSDINPVTTFSDGHLHCLALALAIPCRVEFNPDWDVLVVDDPLFGIDTGHSARVAELLAELVERTGKQLVATTYYAQFARDLEHLAGAERWEVSPYSSDGLKVEAKGDEIETLVRTAEVLKGGEAASRREAGGKLRGAFELLTERIGRPFGGKGQMSPKWRIDQRIDRLEDVGIDPDLLKRLRTVGDRVNKASHAEETDPTPEEVGWCCEHIRELAVRAPKPRR